MFLFIVGGIFAVITLATTLPNLLFSGLRIYVTGSVSTSTITACMQTPIQIRGGEIGYTYQVTTAAIKRPLDILNCDPTLSLHQQVSIVYSAAAEKGVAIRGKATFWNTIRSAQGDILGLFVFICAGLFAFLLVIWRTTELTRHAIRVVSVAFNQAREFEGSRIQKADKTAELITDTAFLLLLFVLMAVISFVMLRGLLFIRTGSEFWFGLLGSLVLGFIWTPLPLWLSYVIWGAYSSSWFRLVRNIVLSILMLLAIWHVAKLGITADFSTYRGPWELFKEVILAAFGE